ncbi:MULTISPECIES: hypothetical protein [unclassified Methylophilus]|uniref:hypothetical protein n=1 Tax=unclassified Methylophilus TaxID=2630143 RepID=UPI0006F7D9E2|nr:MULTISPECIES: hypothetical protein [unclassified Methylophilus]KQT42611.1 hypothetical protein ASG34_07755 [Methylophilus sp. Leaf416]KQT56796.1 hypothetical protein ASG44_07730 [Methylophilus sp. Leaf459]
MDKTFTGILIRYHLKDGFTQPIKPLDELHINLWEIGKPFIDMGLMISQWKEIDSIEITIPWRLDDSNVYDLGTSLNSEQSIAAIFNESVQYNGRADTNIALVHLLKNAEDIANQSTAIQNKFLLLRLAPQDITISYTNLSTKDEITNLKIKIPALKPYEIYKENIDRLYVRFRIINIPRNFYQSIFCQPDSNILSSYVSTRIVDFRINVRRGIPKELLINSDKVIFPPLKKIHFFLTINRNQECIFQGQNFVGCRSLTDEEIWNYYVESHSDSDKDVRDSVRNYLGYQWTKSNIQDENYPVKDLVALGRFSETSSGILHICRFIFLGLGFGMAGNGLWEILSDPHQATNKDYWLIIGVIALGMLAIFSPSIFAALQRSSRYNATLDKVIQILTKLKSK